MTELYGDVNVVRDLRIPVADGTILRADLWRPAGVGARPVLLSRQPYDKVQAQSLTFAHPAWYARHGYAVVVQDVRGRWASGGDFHPFVNEADDGAASCAWVAEQPWCNGRIGMWGFSYAGATQLLAATRRPPGLAAIVPVHTSSDFYEGWTYRGGALALAFALPWAAFLAMDTARRAGDASAEARLLHGYENPRGLCEAMPLGAVEPLRSTGFAPYYFDWLAHERNDEFWRSVSIEPQWPQIAVPALHIGGWYDIFVDGTVRNYQGIAAAGAGGQRLHVGPWAHMPWGRRLGVRDFGPAAVNRIDQLALSFFDTHLRDAGTGGAAEVTGYVLGRGGDECFAAWPPPEALPRSLYLRSRGRANTADGDGLLSPEPASGAEPPDLFTYDPAFPVGSLGGHSCCFPHLAPMGPADQTPVETLNEVLCYTSPLLRAPMLLAGEAELILWAQTSAVDTDWTAKLCVVDRDGRSVNLRETIVRARIVAEPGISLAGRAVAYRLLFGNVCAELAAGERIRLQISSSDFPQWDRNLNAGLPVGQGTLADRVVATQAVWHGADAPSRLVLPAIGDGWW